MRIRTECRSPRWSLRFWIVAHAQSTATTCTSSRTTVTPAYSIERRRRLRFSATVACRSTSARTTCVARRPRTGEAGVDRFHIAHVLNHRSVTHSTVTAIYDRYRYDKEKRAALVRWEEVLFGIVEQQPGPNAEHKTPLRPANVLEFRRARQA